METFGVGEYLIGKQLPVVVYMASGAKLQGLVLEYKEPWLVLTGKSQDSWQLVNTAEIATIGPWYGAYVEGGRCE